MQKFTVISLLCLLFLTGCGYVVRSSVSNVFYQGGQEFNVTPEGRGLDYVVAEFKNTDGNKLHGWFIPGKEGFPLIIYFHGNISNVTHGLEKIELLNRLGFSVFSFEYRGYGKSEGRPLYEDDFYRDARSALRYLQRNGWDKSNVIYYGHSLGAAVALNLALEEPPLGIILESAFTSYSGMLKYQAPYIYMFGGWKAREFNNISKISKVKRPIVLFHGSSDLIVPSAMLKKLYDAAQNPKKMVLVEGANHVNTLELSSETLTEDLAWFLHRGEVAASTQ